MTTILLLSMSRVTRHSKRALVVDRHDHWLAQSGGLPKSVPYYDYYHYYDDCHYYDNDRACMSGTSATAAAARVACASRSPGHKDNDDQGRLSRATVLAAMTSTHKDPSRKPQTTACNAYNVCIQCVHTRDNVVGLHARSVGPLEYQTNVSLSGRPILGQAKIVVWYNQQPQQQQQQPHPHTTQHNTTNQPELECLHGGWAKRNLWLGRAPRRVTRWRTVAGRSSSPSHLSTASG